jgi:O-antigen/teichoic acid export membrane protein
VIQKIRSKIEIKENETEQTLIKGVKLNAVTGYLNFIANAILTFFISPILVSYVGVHNFGLWKTIAKFLDFTTIADGRATQALKWIIARKEKNGSNLERQQAIGSAFKIWLYFLPFLIILIFSLVYILPNIIQGLQRSEYDLIRIVGVILGVNIILNPLFGIPDAILVGTNKGYKSVGFQTVALITTNILMVVFTSLGYGIIGIAFVVLFSTFFNGIIIFLLCKRNTPWFGIKSPSKLQVREFFGFSAWVLVWSFIMRLLLASEIIILSLIYGPEKITQYTFTIYIVQLGIAISLITGSAIMPGLGGLIGMQDKDRAISIIRNTREIILLIAILFGAVILLLNPSFVTLWVGNEFYLGNNVNLFIVLLMIQLIIIRNEGQIQDLSLKIKRKVVLGLLSSFGSLFLGILCFKIFSSIESVFCGLFIGRLVLSFSFPHMVNDMLGITDFNYKMIIGSVIIILSYIVGTYMPILNSWWFFVLYSLFVCLLLITTCFFLILSKNSRKFLLKGVIKNHKH